MEPNTSIQRLAQRSAMESDYHDWVRWGPIFGGLVITLSTQLVLTAVGAAIGLTNVAVSGAKGSLPSDVGIAVGLWSVTSVVISLFLGGWVTARTSKPMDRGRALLNGAILWATTLAISDFLLTLGVTAAFGIVGSQTGEVINQAQRTGMILPDTSSVGAQQARDVASHMAKVGWSFALGSVVGLAASLLGVSVGNRNNQPTTRNPASLPRTE